MRILPAKGAIARFLRSRDLGAITLPPRGVYVLAERINDVGLIAHETVHWEQYERMGSVRFYATYLWGLLRHGYSAEHPMEREARDKTGVK